MLTRSGQRILAIFCGFAIALLMTRLGFWQLERATQKKQLHQAFTERSNAPRLPLESASTNEITEQLWRPARLTGAPLTTVLLLDNRVRDGIPGYEVLTPVRLPDARTVLLNRGWLQAPARRDEWPTVSPISALTGVHVRIAPSPSTGVRLAAFAPERGPEPFWRIQAIDFAGLSSTLGLPLEPYQLLLDADQPDGYDRAWALPDPSSAKHEAYAFQWFAMAIALMGLTVYYGFIRFKPQAPATP